MGDVFYRDGYRQPKPTDWAYSVRDLQRIVLRGYYGEPLDMVQITAHSHVLGPATITLGVNETVWVTDESGLATGSSGSSASNAPSASNRPLRWVRRRRS